MATLTTPKTWADGDIPDWKEFGTEIFGLLDHLYKPPTCWIRANSSTSLTNGVFVPIVMNLVVTDMTGVDAMFNPAQPTRVTPKMQGRYIIYYGASWDNVACGCSGRRIALLKKNGTTWWSDKLDERAGSSVLAFKVSEGLTSYMYFNGTTDYVELYQYTDGGTVSNGNASDGWYSSIYVRWVSRV